VTRRLLRDERGSHAGLAFATALAALIFTTAAPARGADTPLVTVIARAVEYVEGYQRDLAMIVSEERYEQEVRFPGSPLSRARDLTQKTVLRSDFLLVRDAAAGWVPFRDVFERDGVMVRDRDERLSRLFLAGAGTTFEQARRIADESTRYNVGNIDRNINLPTLALVFLTDAHRERFEFSDRGRDGTTRVVQYRETGHPTYVATTGGADLPVSGRYWIDEPSGRIQRTELLASDRSLDARIGVVYRPDNGAGLWVPERMEELYVQHTDQSEIRGKASYSRFRRFQVSTTEDLAK
jgi:hypothetical protein